MTQRRPIDLKLVDQLLAFRQAGAGCQSCPGMATVAIVLAGEADADQIRTAGQHLETCAECADLVRQLRALEEKPAVEPARSRPGFRLQLAWVAAGVLVLAVAGFFTWNIFLSGPTSVPTDGFVLKGGADSIDLAVLRGNTRFTAHPGDRLLEGDRLGFFYSAETAGTLAVIDLSAAGEATVLFPQGRELSDTVQPGHQIPLPDNGTVHRVEGCEWLVAVFADRPLALAGLRDQLLIAARTSLPDCALEPAITGARTVWVFPVR